MEINFSELREKAAEQKLARTEESRKLLETVRMQESERNARIQNLINKAGKKTVEDNKAAMENQVDIAVKHAEERIRDQYKDETEIFRTLHNRLMDRKK